MNRTLLVCLLSVFVCFLSIVFPAGAQASVGVSPGSLSFGSVTVNTSSSMATVLITNNTGHSVTVQSISSSLPEFVVSGMILPLSLSAQSTASFSVGFLPDRAQTYSGKIYVTIDSRNSLVKTVSVSGTGVPSTAPATYLLSSSTSSLSFGSILVGSSSSSQPVTLTNTGSGTVTISQLLASNAAFKVSGFSGSASLSAGQSLALSVGFAPSAMGSTAGALTVTSNATNAPTTIALSGTGIQPQISVSPTSASFGSVTMGSSTSQTFTVSNPGTANLTINQASLSGSGFASSGLATPMTLAPGASSSFTANFAPTAAGSFNGTLTLVNNSPTSSLSVALSGTGMSQTLQLSASPTALSFGSVLTGSSATKTVTLTNTGTGSLSIASDSVSGTGFTVMGLTLPLTLAANQSTSFNVAFAPTGTASVTGSLSVTSNATNSPTTIALSGTGTQPKISVTPASVGFGNVTAGVTNSQTVTISNPGTANLTVTQATVSGTGFAQSGLTLPLTVAPANSSTFTVSFAPTAAGTFSGSVTLANNSPTPSLAVVLSGTGVAQTLTLSASPTSLSFGSVTTGSSASQTVTLTNTGNASVTLSNDSVAGNGFALTGLPLPLTVSAGQSTSFSAVFAPTTTGSVSGSVTVTSNASNSPTTISLSGTGAAPPTYSATVSWTPSSSSYSGFNVYRSAVSGGPYTKVDASLVTSPTYTDSNVTGGNTYYYVVTEVDASGNESAYSSQVSATIP